ncbi:VOC family protein [Sciscionella marina]|uniref:VOC family protein n=1 Tax=Sciscionella marina TaxID=508770 RepID=UPI000381CBCE|nr:VOC family protein [Sciscionella marina]
MTTQLNNPGVWPCLQYTDAEAARVFLTEVFGFTETLTVRSEDGTKILHAELRWPEGGGVMYGDAQPDNHPEYPQPTGIQWLCVVTADPDAVHRRAVEAGAKIVAEPYDADYGARNVCIADPGGHVWTFGTYAGS